ncbi:MAG TPA: right-handed parallel beta-helix repeat-containing protein [Thioploca sp.]|nr:right-handed parallel beta-helix repeat-containing protein [Thioploca sp.]
MFKKLLSILLLAGLVLALPLIAQGTTYYVSSSDGNDANDGTSEATPWQTIDKANSVILDENSSLLFKRGEVFRGGINTKKFRAGITFGAYGTGENPIIAGSVEIKGWTKTTPGSKVYEADVSALPLTDNGIEHLFVNGELMTIARYPNVDSPADKNWLNVDASAGKDAFTDPALVAYSKPDGYWKGATLRIRTYSWYYKVFEITGYKASNGKITAAGSGLGGGAFPLDEWGYFVDGKLEELDHPGEWYYDADAKKVYIYPKNGANPNNLLVEGSTYGTGVSVYWHEDNSTVENLTFRHFTSKGVSIIISDNITVRNCHFEYNTIGVSLYKGADVLITGNTFDHQLSTAVGLGAPSDFDVKNSTAEQNQITNTGMFPLYCSRYDGTCYGIGISASGKGFTVRQNTVENTGWNGIYLKGDGYHLAENNVVRNALALLNDGGAISLQADGNIIIGNFLLDTSGNVDESNGCATTNQTPCNRHTSYGMGIGVDYSNLENTVIEGNTIANNADVGIRLRGYINTTVRDNVLYNNDPQIRMEIKDKPSHSNVVEDNIVYSLKPDQIGLDLRGETNYGTFNKNFYCNPYNEVALSRAGKKYALPHWQKAFSSYDRKSKWCGLRFEEYSVKTVGANLILNSTFDADVSNWGGIFDANKAEMEGGSLKAVHPGTGNLNISPNSFDLVENQLYRLKFSVIGNGFGNIRLRINDVSSGTNILKESYFAYDKNRKDYEMFFQSPVSTSAGKMLFTTQNYDADTFWLDNVTFELVDATLNDATQKSVLFTNMTAENPKTISLEGQTYLDLDGNTVTGSIALAPFSSQILILASDAPPPPSNYALTIQKVGTGSGKVASLPTGINCGTDCTANYQSSTEVILTATADAGSTFVGFSGTNCSESFTITADMNCTATFDKVAPQAFTLTIQTDGMGSGKVISNPTGIDCGSDCTANYQSDTAVTLTAAADAGSIFAGFSGTNCSESFLITADMSCTATFNKVPPPPEEFALTIQTDGMGSGKVTSNPTGIDCGTDCTANYLSGTTVTLTARPETYAAFLEWMGDDCSGFETSITVTMDAAKNCTAVFDFVAFSTSPPEDTLTVIKIGEGTVTSEPAGITCGATCSADYPSGTTVTLTATPVSHTQFIGFGGDADCNDGQVTLDEGVVCVAEFELLVAPPVPTCPTSGSINEVCDGQGQTLVDVTIGTDGQVNNVELEGDITNNGIIFNLHANANTQINGGKLAGQITGDCDALPRLENLEIQPGSELSCVVLGNNVNVPFDEVKLGKGVRFTSNQQIPTDLEQTELLPTLPNSLACTDKVTQPAHVDFSTDVLLEGENILSAINQLPSLKDNDWEMTQEDDGNLHLSRDTLHFAVQPSSVKRSTESAQLQVQDDQSIRFITDTGRNILTQPALQAPCELQAALEALGFLSLTVQPNGNVKIAASEDSWLSVRPAFVSVEVAQDSLLGIAFTNSAVVSDVPLVYLVFTDSYGKQRQQMISPAVAVPEALYASAQEITVKAEGMVSFKLDDQTYRGVVDYMVTNSTQSTANDEVQVEPLPDMNGDGIADFVLFYPTGEQQTLFTVPVGD